MKLGVIVMVIVMSIGGCSGTDYGPATTDTKISVMLTGGGFGGDQNDSFELTSTNVSYNDGTNTASTAVTTDDVEDMIGAFEDVNFLDQIQDLTNCDTKATEQPFAVITAELSAGSNEVRYDTNCRLANLDTLIARLMDLSGFDSWEASN